MGKDEYVHLSCEDHGNGSYTVRDVEKGYQVTLRDLGGGEYVVDIKSGKPFVGTTQFRQDAENMIRLTKSMKQTNKK